MKKTILIVEDDIETSLMIEDFLKQKKYTVIRSITADEALNILHNNNNINTILADLNLPGMNGIELCSKISIQRSEIPVIVMTAFGSIDAAVKSIRSGAYDFITKPFDFDLLTISIERAVNYNDIQIKIKELSKLSNSKKNLNTEIIGESPVMQDLLNQVYMAAKTETTVLITGQSGTGKELIAKTLHNNSSRRDESFVTVNCSAIPESLIESELFGYTKGSFTDAKENRTGLFHQANNGTLFLDEIGDIPLIFQVKLLRTLEERKIRPIGSNKEESIDVRIIAATNRDLEKLIDQGLFREDLYYRINVIQLNIPPLHERGMDIIILAEYFISLYSKRFNKEVTGISGEAVKILLDYQWNGNVRELRNVMERAVALTGKKKIEPGDLPEKLNDSNKINISVNSEKLVTLEELEKKYILNVLNKVDNNYTAASQILGIDRKTLYRKLQKYNNR